MNAQSTLPALLLLSAALAPAVPAIALIEDPAPIVATQDEVHPVEAPATPGHVAAFARSAYDWTAARLAALDTRGGVSRG